MSAWTHEKDALLMNVASNVEYFLRRDGNHAALNILHDRMAETATPPKASAGVSDEAVSAAKVAGDALWRSGIRDLHCWRAALEAAAPILTAERDAIDIAALKTQCDRYEQMGMARGQACLKLQETLAERDAEIERLKAALNNWRNEVGAKASRIETLTEQVRLAQLDATNLSRTINELRNPDIEATAKRLYAMFDHANAVPFAERSASSQEHWRVVARAVLTGKSEGG